MAKTTKIDELNIVEYFSEMNLPESEIDKRIALAESIKGAYYKAFLEIKKQQREEDTFIEDYIEDMLVDAYKLILSEQGISTNDYVYQHINSTIKEVIDVTKENITTDYYLSLSRAAIIAVNDANAICNYELEQRAINEGKTTKRWDTMKDLKVRHTHVMADGQEVGINEMFEVGNCKMRFPCDSQYGTAEEIINCRCVCLYSK